MVGELSPRSPSVADVESNQSLENRKSLMYRNLLAIRALAIALTLVAGLTLARESRSDSMPLLDISSSDDTFACGNATCGYNFVTGQDSITVTHLGMWDFLEDGLSGLTLVGLWDNSATLLASVSVSPGTGTLLVNGFRYAPISPLILSADTTYVLGANSPSNTIGDTRTVTMHFGATFGEGQKSGQGTGFAFPTIPVSAFFAEGDFGPNALVPEPSTSLLLGLGFGAVGLTRRKRGRLNS
jgi:hypothetical protein